MDSRLQRLRFQRQQLQARLRRADESREFRALAPALRAAGVRRLCRMPPARSTTLVVQFDHLPARNERFYWHEIAGGKCVGFDTPTERNEAFVAALHACFAPATRLACIFHTSESSLVLGCDAAVAHADLLLHSLKETLWVTPTTGAPRLVEVSFSDRQVCWLTEAS